MDINARLRSLHLPGPGHLGSLQTEAEAHARARAWVTRMAQVGFSQLPEYPADAACLFDQRRFRSGSPRLPYCDHARAWRKKGVGVLFTSQPYEHGYTDEALAETRAFCEKHGLQMRVRPELSWWYPSKTGLVIIGNAEVMELFDATEAETVA